MEVPLWLGLFAVAAGVMLSSRTSDAASTVGRSAVLWTPAEWGLTRKRRIDSLQMDIERAKKLRDARFVAGKPR